MTGEEKTRKVHTLRRRRRPTAGLDGRDADELEEATVASDPRQRYLPIERHG